MYHTCPMCSLYHPHKVHAELIIPLIGRVCTQSLFRVIKSGKQQNICIAESRLNFERSEFVGLIVHLLSYLEKKNLDCDFTSRDEALREIKVRAIVTKQSKQLNLRFKARWNIFKWPHVKHAQKTTTQKQKRRNRTFKGRYIVH